MQNDNVVLPYNHQRICEEISFVQNGALAENLVTQANVINITDVAEEM